MKQQKRWCVQRATMRTPGTTKVNPGGPPATMKKRNVTYGQYEITEFLTDATPTRWVLATYSVTVQDVTPSCAISRHNRSY